MLWAKGCATSGYIGGYVGIMTKKMEITIQGLRISVCRTRGRGLAEGGVEWGGMHYEKSCYVVASLKELLDE